MLRAGASLCRRSGRCCATARRDDIRLRQGRPARARRARSAVAGDRCGMSALAEHLDELPRVAARASGSSSSSEGGCCATSSRSSKPAGQRTITTESRAAVGTAAGERLLRLPGSADARRPRLRPLPARARPRLRDPAADLLPASKHRPSALHLHRRGDHRADDGGRQLRPPLRAATSETLIGLLACTGLRIGEAFALDRDDIDWTHGCS